MNTGPEATTIVRDFQPINPQAGDILQLYEGDGIHVTDGGIAMMVLRYKTKHYTINNVDGEQNLLDESIESRDMRR